MDNFRLTSAAEDRVEAEVRRRWEDDAALRAEFCDNLAAACAYFKAEARGAVGFYGGKGLHRVKLPAK